MQIFSVISFIGLSLTGIANGIPTRPSLSSGTVTTGFYPPPPGLDISKHQKFPEGFKIPEEYSKASTTWPPATGLQKRQDPNVVHVVLCDNWYWQGQCLDFPVTPNGNSWLVNWFPPYNMDNRASSFIVYTDAGAAKRCRFYDTYFVQNGVTYCSGASWEATAWPGSAAMRDVLQGNDNDKITCGSCWQI